ncbi:MAG: response regulator [Verrucomicrobia bacterium]|nr:response regulator [Verrucomicrobiota bacterium]
MNSRILVVDDTPANIQALSAILKEKGFQISVATNGRLALELVARLRPDLILLDVMMPEMDGFETCRLLKASPATRHIPVIFLTARVESEDIVKGFELGAVDYVAKPFNTCELLARVNTHLTLDRLHRENESLLLSILPASIAARLKSGEAGIADHFPEVSVLFADIVDFTTLSNGLSPQPLVALLNDLFTQFDHLANEHNVEKIKTIGDCYMAVCGVPENRPDHAAALADMALGIVEHLKQFNRTRGTDLKVRIGLNTGPVVAGVIGRSKFIYDLWGDTVNTASRMEATGLPNRVQVTAEMQRVLAVDFDFEERGEIEVKGKGRLRTWLLLGRKTDSSRRPDAPVP